MKAAPDVVAREARRLALEAALRCAYCTAQNRPGALYVELDPTTYGRVGWTAFCSVCGRHWFLPDAA